MAPPEEVGAKKKLHQAVGLALGARLGSGRPPDASEPKSTG